MSADLIARLAGVMLSLAFAYVPGVKTKFEALAGEKKALVMLIALFAVTVGAFGFSCLGWFDVQVTCDQAGAESLVSYFVVAAIANQATFLVAVKPFQKG